MLPTFDVPLRNVHAGLQDASQFDARGSTFNDVRRDQYNNVNIVMNNQYVRSSHDHDDNELDVCKSISLLVILDTNGVMSD